MFKIVCVFTIVAVAATVLAEPKADPKADPKPTVFAYSAPVAAVEAAPVVPAATVYETSFHGNLAPVAAVAAYSAGPVLAAPLAYSYPYYDPLVAAPILLRK